METILTSLKDFFPSILTLGVLGVAAYKVYRKVMTAIEETQHTIKAGIEVQNAFRKATADGKITADEVKEIEEAIEVGLQEGRGALEVWSEAKDDLLALIETAKSRRRTKK